MQKITNALELFNAAKIYSRLTPEVIRNASRNHNGCDKPNRAQFIGMEKSGDVWVYGFNPASIRSGSIEPGYKIELVADAGCWDGMWSTVHEHIGKLNPEHYDWQQMLFPIDDSFYPLGE